MTTANKTLEKLIDQSYDLQGLIKASQILTTIAWDQYPSNAFKHLVEEIKTIFPELGELISDKGITFTVLWNDKTSASGYFQKGIQIDTEEWYSDYSKNDVIKKLKEFEDTYDQVRDAFEKFQCSVEKEIREYLNQNDILDSDLDNLVD